MKLLLLSATPANAVYHARNAANNPNNPPVLMRAALFVPGDSWMKWPIERKRNARSSVRNKKKKTHELLSVQARRSVVKIHQPYHSMVSFLPFLEIEILRRNTHNKPKSNSGVKSNFIFTRDHFIDDVEATGSVNDRIRDPETSVRRKSSCAERVTNSHFPSDYR